MICCVCMVIEHPSGFVSLIDTSSESNYVYICTVGKDVMYCGRCNINK